MRASNTKSAVLLKKYYKKEVSLEKLYTGGPFEAISIDDSDPNLCSIVCGNGSFLCEISLQSGTIQARAPLSYAAESVIRTQERMANVALPYENMTEQEIADQESADEPLLLALSTVKLPEPFDVEDNQTHLVLAAAGSQLFLFARTTSKNMLLKKAVAFKLLKRWAPHKQPVASLTFGNLDMEDTTNKSRRFLAASGTSDGKLRVWKLSIVNSKSELSTVDAICIASFDVTSIPVRALSFHPDGRRRLLASGDDSGQVCIFDLHGKGLLSKTQTHESPVSALCWALPPLKGKRKPTATYGSYLVSAGRDRMLCIKPMDCGPSAVARNIPVLDTITAMSPIQDIPISAESSEEDKNGAFVGMVGTKGIIRVWNIVNGKMVMEQTQDGTQSSMYRDILPGEFTFSYSCFHVPSSRVICSTADQDFLSIRLPSTVIESSTQKLCIEKCIVGYSDEIVDIAYVEGGKRLAVASNSETLRIFDPNDWSCQYLLGHDKVILSISVSKNGNYLISGGKDCKARLWNLKTGKCVAVFSGHTEAIGSTSFFKKSPNYFVTGSHDRTLKVWNIGDELLEDKVLNSPKQISVAKITVHAHDKDINSVDVSPNDRFIASGSQDKTIKIFGSQSLDVIATLRGHKRGIWHLAFSPYDKVLVSCSGDKTIKIWSMADFSCIKTFEGHTTSVLRCIFINYGTQLVSVAGDGIMKIWSIKTHECVGTIDAHNSKVWALSSLSEGTHLVTGGSDSRVQIWRDCTEEKLLEEAEKIDQQTLQEQDLLNQIRAGHYDKAVFLALELDRPYSLFNVFKDMILHKMNKEMTEIIGNLSMPMVERCLLYARDWNTSAKTASVAQLTVKSIFSGFLPQQLAKLPRIREIITALLPYTERHFKRYDHLLQQTWLIDYSLHSMGALDVSFIDSDPTMTENNLHMMEVGEQQQNSHDLGDNDEVGHRELDDDEIDTPGSDKDAAFSNGDYVNLDNGVQRKGAKKQKRKREANNPEKNVVARTKQKKGKIVKN